MDKEGEEQRNPKSADSGSLPRHDRAAHRDVDHRADKTTRPLDPEEGVPARLDALGSRLGRVAERAVDKNEVWVRAALAAVGVVTFAISIIAAIIIPLLTLLLSYILQDL